MPSLWGARPLRCTVTATSGLRVVVAEDQALLRARLVGILERAGMEVVTDAADATGLLRKARAHTP